MKLFHINNIQIKDIPVENRSRRNSIYTKADKILIVMILLMVAASTIILGSINSDIGDTVRITVDGKIYGEYDLKKDQKIEVKLDSGHNIVAIREGRAYMESADCPDKYCVEYAPINQGNQTIICLPHKLVVEVLSNHDEIDAVVE